MNKEIIKEDKLAFIKMSEKEKVKLLSNWTHVLKTEKEILTPPTLELLRLKISALKESLK